MAVAHVDVKKLGNIPTGGGWRFVGRPQGKKNRAATPGVGRSPRRNVLLGHAFVHTVIDDHSRVAYAKIHDDETAATAIGVLRRAVGWFAMRGVTVERFLSDNGSCYRSHAWREACVELQIRHKKTRPYRPQTSGKIERFHRTMGAEWAFARSYPNEQTRRSALPAWLHTYNHHRQHSAIGKVPPITRLTTCLGSTPRPAERKEGRIPMSTCLVHYAIDPRTIKAFESFAAAPIRLVDHHGYFMPSEGASDGARALFSFPSMAGDERYRQRFDFDAAFIAADCIRDERGCVLSYECLFLGAHK
jgi:hypothetical protein